MRELHVRLEPQAEPRCGFTADAVVALQRSMGGGAMENITAGLIFPRAANMALRAPIDPLLLALTVRNELFFAPAGMLLAYTLELERENARIIERGRQQFLKTVREPGNLLADKKRAARKAARGTRSTRRHGKKKAGR